MTGLPHVLGLSPEKALERLRKAGFVEADVRETGRRREGVPRVVRCTLAGERPELVVSHFKELIVDGGAGRESAPLSEREQVPDSE